LQDQSGLGDAQAQRIVTANTRTKILMATEHPEDIASLAGTTLAIEASIQYEEGDATGMGSAREQHKFKVDPNEVGKLQAGEAFLIRQRRALKFKVSPVPHIEKRPGAVAAFPKRQATPTSSDSGVSPEMIPDA
jgi:hypothetical protein